MGRCERHQGISARRLPLRPPRIRGSGHGRVAGQPQHGVGHAPVVLLGGSPLDMAAPPSPSSHCGRDHRTIPASTCYRAAPRAEGPHPVARGPIWQVPCLSWTWPVPPKPRNSGPRSPDGSRRTCLKAGWTGLLPDPRRAQGLQRGVDGQVVRRGVDLRQLAHRVRRKGPQPAATGRAERAICRAGAPLGADFFGDTLVGPTLCRGHQEEKQQFIPGILKGEIAWCQGFSEPDAGSDLAGRKTRAESTATSGSSTGRRCGRPRRTTPTTSSSLPARTPTRRTRRASPTSWSPCGNRQWKRAIEQVDGSAEFNQVFFTSVRCPKDNVIGGVNNGWKVAMTTLGFERGTSSTTGHRRFQKEFEEILDQARRRGRASDPLTRQRLARSGQKLRSCRSTASARSPMCSTARTPPPRRRVRQDVLVGGTPGDVAARYGHPGHGGPDPARRPGRGHPAARGPGRKRATPSTTCSRCSSARRLSRAGQPRFNGTSWASACSAYRRSRNPIRRRRAPARRLERSRGRT